MNAARMVAATRLAAGLTKAAGEVLVALGSVVGRLLVAMGVAGCVATVAAAELGVLEAQAVRPADRAEAQSRARARAHLGWPWTASFGGVGEGG